MTVGDTMSVNDNRETLSAWLDGEATELEARRLMRDLNDDDTASLARWQLARDLMQGHQAVPVPEGFNQRLLEALADGDTHRRPAWMHPIASLAVAASVAVATVIGWQYWEYTSAAAKPAMASSEARLPRLLGAETDLVSQSLLGQTRSAAMEQEQERLDAMMVRHNEYVTRHSPQGVTASARFISQDAQRDAALPVAPETPAEQRDTH